MRLQTKEPPEEVSLLIHIGSCLQSPLIPLAVTTSNTNLQWVTPQLRFIEQLLCQITGINFLLILKDSGRFLGLLPGKIYSMTGKLYLKYYSSISDKSAQNYNAQLASELAKSKRGTRSIHYYEALAKVQHYLT